MSKFKMRLLFVFFILSLLFLSPTSTESPAIGVTYRPHVPNLPSSDRVVSALTAAGIRHVTVQNPSPNTLRSFLYSDISLLISIPNSLVPDLASSNSSSSAAAARRWLSDHVLPFHPRLNIAAIAVGHDDLSEDLIPAIGNLAAAASDLGLPNLTISTIHSFKILDPSFPPSRARFQPFLFDPYIKPLLDLLSSTRSPFLIDLFPFDLYRSNLNVPIGFAIFEDEEFVFRDDEATGLRYRNLFDEMVDSTLSALARAGHGKMPVVVAGTGWPTGGCSAATVDLAEKFNRGLVEHLRSGIGTPMKREALVAVYVHELFDDSGSKWFEWERHWGIWYRNLSKKYEIEFSKADGGRLKNSGVLFGVWGWVVLVMTLI